MKYLVLLALAICAAHAATITSAPRENTWKQGNGTGAIYDITVFNDADCALVDIGINPGFPAGSEVLSYWNLEAGSRFLLVTNFGGELQPGQSATAGAILLLDQAFGSPLPSLVPTIYGTNCATPSTSSPTPSASPSTTAPTNEPTEAPSSCDVSATLSLGSSWTTDGEDYASYHVVLSNNGDCPLSDYVTSFGLNGGEILNTWNLESTRGGYAVKGFGELLNAGDSYGGAGFNVKLGDGDITVTPYGSNCRC